MLPRVSAQNPAAEGASPFRSTGASLPCGAAMLRAMRCKPECCAATCAAALIALTPWAVRGPVRGGTDLPCGAGNAPNRPQNRQVNPMLSGTRPSNRDLISHLHHPSGRDVEEVGGIAR